MDTIVRPGLTQDIEPALRVWRAAQAFRAGKPVSAHHEGRAVGYLRSSESFFFVGVSADRIVSLALAMQARIDGHIGSQNLEGTCQTSLLSVEPSMAGRGLAKATYAALLRHASTIGFTAARTWTPVDNVAAKNLYLSFSFKETSEYRDDPIRGRLVLFELESIDLTPSSYRNSKRSYGARR